MPSQIPLPLHIPARFGRADFVVGPGNAAAVAFVDNWPDWQAPAAVLYGPSGSGKSHLSAVWAERCAAETVPALKLEQSHLSLRTPLVIEDVEPRGFTLQFETLLFALLERGHSVLFTAHQPPASWKAAIPDLRSRFDALLAFPLWEPDDALLEALAHKLFADRQLIVPDNVILQMIRSLERSPAAVRDFVARADAAAMAEKRPVTLGLIRQLLNED